MGSSAREKLSVRLDWVNVPYRNVYMAGAGAALLLLLAVLAFTFRGSIADWLSSARKDATREIATAERLLHEAAAGENDGKTGSLRESATSKLHEARSLYGRRDYQDARTSAIVSQTYSQKILDLKGGSGRSREVRFYKIEGEVRVKKAGQFRWDDASTATSLHIGDQIKTGSSAVAQIIYFDGTITTIRSESLLEIKELFEEPSTRERRVKEKLTWGEVETSTRKANVAGSFHEIQSQSATAKSSDEAEFRVAYDQGKDAGRVTSFSGKVDVSTSEADVTMTSGETLAIDKGVMGTVEKLPPEPRLMAPSDQKIFVYAKPKDASTTLAWEKVPEALRYHLQLSERSLFSDLLLDKGDVRRSLVELPGLPPSAYYWRVAAVDARGRASSFSPARKFRISTTEFRDKSDRSPPVLAVQDIVQNGPYVIVNGKTEPGATLWVDGERRDVDESGVFYAVLKLKKEGMNLVRVVAQDPAGNESRKALEAFWETY